jgi:DNA invertase Pin-like site-specific DNA recombinase
VTRARIWLRVSTDEQEADNQLDGCRRRAAYGDAGAPWVCAEADVYRTTVSASGPEFDRDPERARVFADARAGRLDVVVVWALDRWTRGGILALLSDVESLRRSGVRLISVQEPWAENDLLLAIAAWQAQQEKIRRRERTRAAHARQREAIATAGGFYARPKVAGQAPRWVTRFGRPGHEIAPHVVVRALALRVAGFSWRAVAGQLAAEGLGAHDGRTLQRRCDEARKKVAGNGGGKAA